MRFFSFSIQTNMLIILALLFICFSSICNGLQNPYCSLSCNFGGATTYLNTVCERDAQKCGPDPSCGPDFREIPLTDDLRQYILDLHNQLRNNVASGNETRNGQPSASKMLTLRYNKELEFIAQCWANTCHGNPLIHDVCRATKKHEHVGQNLGYINSTNDNFDLKQVATQLIMYWYDEVALFKSEWVNDTRDRGPNYKVGHYTQMIWSDTDSVGCAMSYYTDPNPYADVTEPPQTIHTPYGDVIYFAPIPNDKWHSLLLVCNYSPGGNYIGAPLYKVGTPCSNCPENQPCSEYSSLCGRSGGVKDAQDSFVSFFRY